MKKSLIILSVLLLGLTACNKANNESTSGSVIEEVDPSRVENSYNYKNRLKEPSSTIHNIDDLMAITDYHAFYKDVTSFEVNLASDYTYASPQKTMENEINYLYWYGELINGMMGIYGEVKDSSTWTINYVYYPSAIKDGVATTTLKKDVFYKETSGLRNDQYNEFATEDETKPLCDVATTQQLFYAAEHGYRINAFEDSSALNYYDKCKTVLRNIISDDMTDYQKVSTIYDYIEHHATYDYEALNDPDTSDMDNFPDEYAANRKCYYIEGFFDNSTVVCDGYSKIYSLMCNMEGIQAYRRIGSADKRWVSKAVPGHAYCFINLDNTYYLSCPTWGQYRIGNKIVTEKYYFLSPLSYISPYDTLNYQDLNLTNSMNNVDYFKNNKVSSGGETLSAYVGLNADSSKYFALLNENDTYMDLYFSSSSLANNFINNVGSKINYFQTNDHEYVFYR